MKVLLIVPLIGVVLSAPLADEENIEKSPIVKRAMETIMFGNQQNSNKQVKKSDPSVPLRDIPDVNAPVLPDVGGSVEAEKAVDLPESTNEDLDESESTGEESTENGSVEKSAQNSEEEISPENQAAIDELTKSVKDDSKESSEVQTSNGDNLSGGDNYDNYDLFELYKEYQNMLSQRPRYNYYYDTYRRRRRNAKSKRTFMSNLRETVVKRAHRTKRDLTYPDESDLYAPYYYPEVPYMDSDIYGRYGLPYETEEEPTLEEILAESSMPYQLEEPSLYEYRPLRYEEEEEPYVPVKRQSMLSFVPGNRKRSSYFYPANEEPETHFGAFIPSKREYFDTYGSLVKAARLLAARDEERGALQGYEDWYKR